MSESRQARRFRRRWVAWLLSRGLPIPHTAIVLESDVGTVETFWAEHRTTHSSDPSWPPHTEYHRDPGARTIRAEQYGKVARLRDLGYSAAETAHFLALSPTTVREFLVRTQPRKDGRPRARPLERAEHQAMQAAARRRRRRERARAEQRAKRAAIASWGKLYAPDNPVEGTQAPAPSRADPAQALEGAAAAQAVAEPPADVADLAIAAPPANHWVGPPSWNSHPRDLHGRTKVTTAHAQEMHRDWISGATIAAIAWRFGVCENTVRNALRLIGQPLPCPADFEPPPPARRS